MREYQQKKVKEFLLPEAVYRQALWAAKDLPRLRERLSVVMQQVDSLPQRDFSVKMTDTKPHSDLTGRKAGELANLSLRIESIEGALMSIPEKYRSGIGAKLFEGKEFDDSFHPNTWKKWQQVYIYNVAMNLGLY